MGCKGTIRGQNATVQLGTNVCVQSGPFRVKILVLYRMSEFQCHNVTVQGRKCTIPIKCNDAFWHEWWVFTQGQNHPSSILARMTIEWKVLIGSFDYPTLLTLRHRFHVVHIHFKLCRKRTLFLQENLYPISASEEAHSNLSSGKIIDVGLRWSKRETPPNETDKIRGRIYVLLVVIAHPWFSNETDKKHLEGNTIEDLNMSFYHGFLGCLSAEDGVSPLSTAWLDAQLGSTRNHCFLRSSGISCWNLHQIPTPFVIKDSIIFIAADAVSSTKFTDQQALRIQKWKTSAFIGNKLISMTDKPVGCWEEMGKAAENASIFDAFSSWT